jgi:hypothetical protein
MKCTLCAGTNTEMFKGNGGDIFYRCNHCFLIFKTPTSWLGTEEEKERYIQHNNTEECPGYVEFLSQALEPTLPFLEPDMEGMDFGCGPNPVLARMVENNGCACSYYDPFFFPELPDERQDFIFATECFEHFFDPHQELKLLTALLRPSGTLTIMTNFWSEALNIEKWWYTKDPTHVAFFHTKTFDYICARYGYDLEYSDNTKVVILRKKLVWQ